MKTKTLTITFILAAIILAPLALAAPDDGPRRPRGNQDSWQGQGPRGGGEQGRRGMRQGPGGGGNFAQMLLGRMGKKLELTEEQKEAIEAIAEEAETEMKESREAVREAMKALHEAAENGSEAEIIAAGKAAGDALTQQALNKAAVSKKIKAELTEEQIAKLEEMKAKMKERMQQRQQEGDGSRGKGRRGGFGGQRGRRGPRPEGPENEEFEED